jgi:hypothetical protein
MGAAGCSIGRTGTVSFGNAPEESARAGSGDAGPRLKGSISES